MKQAKYGFLILVLLLLLFPNSRALAQSYYFSVPKEVVNVYWNEDGTASVDYVFEFNNSDGASAIEYARTPFVFVSAAAEQEHSVTLQQVAAIYAGELQAWPDHTPIRLILPTGIVFE